MDPGKPSQIREAIQLSSTLWGGTYFPIVPLYKRMPRTWAEPVKAPPAGSVLTGYLEAFDPDILIHLCDAVPDIVKASGREIVPGSTIWQVLDSPRPRVPRYGIGIFEILGDVFEKYFRYKAKYPVRVVLPRIPRGLSLFWASIFGEVPDQLVPILNSEFKEPLEIQDIDVELSGFRDLMAPNVLFPRRIVQGRLSPVRRSRLRREGRVFFMDATKTDDIVDFWNLRALGHDTIAIPKQLKTEPTMKEHVAGFLKHRRVPWPHNPKVYDTAAFVRSRNTTMEEMQEFAETLKDNLPPPDDSGYAYYSLQHWYPRIWDEWGADKDGALPDDFYADEEEYDLVGAIDSRVSVKLSLPDFAEDFGYHDQPRCAHDVSIRVYGSPDYVAEVFPQPAGPEALRAVGGPTALHEDWRISR